MGKEDLKRRENKGEVSRASPTMKPRAQKQSTVCLWSSNIMVCDFLRLPARAGSSVDSARISGRRVMSPPEDLELASLGLSEKSQLRQQERGYCYVHLGKKAMMLAELLPRAEHPDAISSFNPHHSSGKQYYCDSHVLDEETEACNGWSPTAPSFRSANQGPRIGWPQQYKVELVTLSL